MDKVAAAVGAKAGLLQPTASANMAGGIVGVSSYVVLPNIGAGTAALLVLLAILPCLVALWRAPQQRALSMVAPAIAYANLCGFMFGYHVHEKAALTIEIPMALAAVRSSDWGQQYVLLSTAAHVGIFPLLFQTQEVPIRWLLAVVYYVICVWGLASIHRHPQGAAAAAAGSIGPAAKATPSKQQQSSVSARGATATSTSSREGGASPGGVDTPSPDGVRTRRQTAQKQQSQAPQQRGPPAASAVAAGAGSCADLSMHECCGWLPLLYRLYLAGLVVLELYCTQGHTALLGGRLPFVPLMLTSVYCAVAFTWVWCWMAWYFVQQCWQ